MIYQTKIQTQQQQQQHTSRRPLRHFPPPLPGAPSRKGRVVNCQMAEVNNEGGSPTTPPPSGPSFNYTNKAGGNKNGSTRNKIVRDVARASACVCATGVSYSLTRSLTHSLTRSTLTGGAQLLSAPTAMAPTLSTPPPGRPPETAHAGAEPSMMRGVPRQPP